MQVNFTIPDDKLARIDQVAAEMNVLREQVLEDALSSYLDLRDWQIRHIERAIEQADAGEFASDEAVARAFEKWTT